MFIIKWEKGMLKALGLHHAGVHALGVAISFFIAGPVASAWVWGWISSHYWQKEKRENGKDFEILDFSTGVIVGGIVFALLNWLLSRGTISYLLIQTYEFIT